MKQKEEPRQGSQGDEVERQDQQLEAEPGDPLTQDRLALGRPKVDPRHRSPEGTKGLMGDSTD